MRSISSARRRTSGAFRCAAVVCLFASVAGAGSIEYPALGNVRLEEGTLEFWFTPTKELYPDIGESRYAGIFSLFSFAVEDHFSMGSGWGVRRDGAVFFVSMSAKGKPKALLPVPSRIKGWKKGEKHHVAFTWRGNVMKLYADGKQVSQRDQATSLTGPLADAKLIVGNRKGRSSHIIVHAFRSSSVARDEAMLAKAEPEQDIYTLLLDRFDKPDEFGEKVASTKAEQIGGFNGETGGTVRGKATFVEKPETGLAL